MNLCKHRIKVASSIKLEFKLGCAHANIGRLTASPPSSKSFPKFRLEEAQGLILSLSSKYIMVGPGLGLLRPVPSQTMQPLDKIEKK